MIRRGLIPVLLVIVCALLPLALTSGFHFNLVIMVFLAVIYTVSLRLVLRSGLLSFGHSAFIGIGAYASVLLTMECGLPFLVSFLLAGVVSAVIGGLVFYPALKVRGAYFVMMTWGVCEVFVAIYKRFQIFGGTQGIWGVPAPEIFGFEFVGKIPYYYMAFILMLVVILICYRLEKSRFGLIVRGTATSEELSVSVGVNIAWYKVTNFAIACFFAGLGGSFLAHYIHLVDAETFGWFFSERIATYMLVGGGGSIWGAIIGASTLSLLHEFWRGATEYGMLLHGGLLILTMLFLPQGLVSIPAVLKRRGISLKIFSSKKVAGNGAS